MQSSTRRQLEEMEQMGGSTFVDELIELFFSESDMRFTKLEGALTRGDLVEAGQIFHQLKGSAASTGTGRLYRICLVGETASEKGDDALARRAGRLGAKELVFLKTSLKEWRRGAPS
ncbi:MAG: Hpt domain-containing protein [Methylacidiphilales bacterium]|nr:Hpt domain-containing protein [Candidatus Methylacidiphilales bacterium]